MVKIGVEIGVTDKGGKSKKSAVKTVKFSWGEFSFLRGGGETVSAPSKEFVTSPQFNQLAFVI